MMTLDPGLAGTPLKPLTVSVPWRRTTNYAAAVGDANPCYFDDMEESGLVAPPTFPVALTWPLVSDLGRFLVIDTFPQEVLITQVHYSEHLILHRLVRPGDLLTLEGEITAILPHRAGTHAVVRIIARDASDAPVFTEYLGAMFRGVTCEGEGVVLDLPEIPAAGEGLAEGWTAQLDVDPLAPYLYDAGSDIVFPIHTSPKFAREVGLPGILLQGTATLAFAIREIVNRACGGDPHRIRELACRFTGMVAPGTPIRVCSLGTEDAGEETRLFFEVLNAEGRKALRNGYVTFTKER